MAPSGEIRLEDRPETVVEGPPSLPQAPPVGSSTDQAPAPASAPEPLIGEVRNVNLWEGEANRLTPEDIDPLLLHCVGLGTSDISLQTDRPVTVEVHGELHWVTRRKLDSADMVVLLEKIYGADAIAKLAGGKDLDLSYEIRPERHRRVRFRVNCTAILSRGRDSVQITMRTLPQTPPTFEQLGIEEPICENWAPRQGLVLVTGPTGSGKSTLLAAGCRSLIERSEGCGKMLTYEAPIEFVYDDLVNEKSLVAQTEIPRHVPTFADGVRNALRRKPMVILVGEARDRETVSAAIEAGQTGHAVYATVHTIGVAATVRRMVSVFEPAERMERSYALMETLRLTITQVLVPKIGGGRIGVREWLTFTDDIREQMLGIDNQKWVLELQRMVPERGRSMAQSAERLYKEGLIEKRWYLMLAQSTASG